MVKSIYWLKGNHGIRWARMSLALALLLLSTCGEIAGGTIQRSGAALSHADARVQPADRPVLKSDMRPNISLATAPLSDPPHRKPWEFPSEPPKRPFVADPARLLGLDFTATKALLGEPASYVEQPPAKIWAYNAGICELNVFFYPTVKGEKYSLLAYEVLDRTISDNDTGDTSSTDTLTAAEIMSRKAGTEIAHRCLAELLGSRNLPDAR